MSGNPRFVCPVPDSRNKASVFNKAGGLNLAPLLIDLAELLLKFGNLRCEPF
jgi:hypothetical protein